MTRARFGVQFRNFPSEYGGQVVDRVLEAAVQCEKAEFDSVWMIDHLEMRPPISYESQPIPDCWSMVSAISSVTSKVKIGSLVSCVLFRNPHYLSRICTTIQDISSGRLIAGLGSGWFEDEFKNYGFPYPSASERIRETRKAVEILHELASIPVWIGGSGEKSTLKLVAKQGDGCSLFGDPEATARKLRLLENYCIAIGRDQKLITKSKHSNVVIGESQAEVNAKMRKIIPDETKWKLFAASNIVGTPRECRDQVERYIESGVEYFTLSFPDLYEVNCLDIFSKSVIGEIVAIGR